MKTPTLMFLLASAAAVPRAQADPAWAWVSASDPARAVAAVPVEPTPGEEVVRLIPAAPAEPPEAVRPRPVVAVALPGRDNEPVPPAAALPAPAESIPGEALWPDRDGLIVAAPPPATAPERNPWESRAKVKAKGRQAPFLFGGYIAGGPGGPVALVNGRGLRPGEDLDGFTVSRIAAAGVVLAHGGFLYVVPPRRRVVIELPGT
jgi:hypothetical protein